MMAEKDKSTSGREKAREAERRYREKNREKINERQRERRNAEPEKARQQSQESSLKHRRENRDKWLQTRRAHYAKNKEKIRVVAKKSYEEEKIIKSVEELRERRRRQYYSRYSKKPWKYLHARMKSRCKYRKNEYHLSEEWFEKRWTGRCEVTGIEFNLTSDECYRFYSPSVDRIDNSLPYLPSNCRIVLDAFNMLKGSGTDEDALRVAEAILQNVRRLNIL